MIINLKVNILKIKGYLGEDIFEGKITIMVIHSLNNSIEKNR